MKKIASKERIKQRNRSTPVINPEKKETIENQAHGNKETKRKTKSPQW
jgi:hypothetical protein